MTFGFVILRHVNSELTDKYWQECYDCIRKYYPENKIVIVDDNSDLSKVSLKELHFTDVILVNSEWKGRGELLPYVYYAKCDWFDVAMIIHDSLFINQKLDVDIEEIEDYLPLFDFDHNCDQPEDEKKILGSLNNSKKILEFHDHRDLWRGIFGGMSIIRHSFLHKLDERYNLENMIPLITSRYNRMSFERVLACILHSQGYPNRKIVKFSFLGDIIPYCGYKCDYTFDEYIRDEGGNILPLIKVFSGR